MSRDELTQLYLADISDARKKLARDMFCLQAVLGARVGDFRRFTGENVRDGQLVYYARKTAEFAGKTVVPLSLRAVEIIEAYRGKDKKGHLMPFLSETVYNKLLKDVFREAGLNRKVMLYRRDEKKEKTFRLYELASSHPARRTFVDILCQAGEPLHVVAAMSGHSEHSEHSQAFGRYRSRPEQLQRDAVKRSMD